MSMRERERKRSEAGCWVYVRIIDKEHTAKHFSVVWLLLLLEITQKKSGYEREFQRQMLEHTMTFHYCPPRRQTRTMTMLHHHIFTYTQKHSLFHSITAFLCALTVPKLLLTVWNKFLVNLITVFVDFQHII